jgi:hypothetical protein
MICWGGEVQVKQTTGQVSAVILRRDYWYFSTFYQIEDEGLTQAHVLFKHFLLFLDVPRREMYSASLIRLPFGHCTEVFRVPRIWHDRGPPENANLAQPLPKFLTRGEIVHPL